ncbi:MAG: tetratricopeptide repeat protein [Hyphomicrobiaceae bacterium]|nr:MAG: tetratricopeptide repeat protein [Hyphomicrobiaceae bacterium]
MGNHSHASGLEGVMLKPRVLILLLTFLALLLVPVADQAAGQESFFGRQFRKLEQQKNQQQRRLSEKPNERRKEAVAENLAEKNRALELYNDGRYAEAEAVLKRLLQRRTSEFGANDSLTAAAHNNLAFLYNYLRRFKEAEHHARRMIAVLEGFNDPDSIAGKATGYANLARALIGQDKFAEAESYFKQGIAIYAVIADRSHSPQVRGSMIHGLGNFYMHQGRLAEAEAVLGKALAIQEKKMGSDNLWTGRVVRSLASLAALRGRPAEAEDRFKRAIAIMEKLTGRDRSELAEVLVLFADFYVDQGRLGEVEPIFKRAIAAYEAAHGASHYITATAYIGLGKFQLETGRLDEAEKLLRQALAIYERAKGPGNSETARVIVSLGNTLVALGRVEEAAPLLKRALDIREKALGREHQLTAESVLALGAMHLAAGRLNDAAAMLSEALRLTEKTLGAEHLKAAQIHFQLGSLHLNAGRSEAALASLQRASQILAARADQTAGLSARGQRGEVNPRLRRAIHSAIAVAAWQRASENSALESELMRQGLLAAQLAQSTTTGAAVSQMSARFAAGNDALAELLRNGQDIANRWQELDKELTQGLGGDYSEEVRSTPRERVAVRKELDRLNVEIGDLNRRLGKEFPDYAALARSDPLGVADIQALLAPDEAAIAFLTLEKATYVWAVTREGTKWHRVEVDEAKLARDVEKLRCGLEADAWLDPARNARCKELGLALTSAELLPYDLSVAHALYARLFSPIESLIAGKSLIMVPSGPLTSLSFHALLTEPPTNALPDAAGYKTAPWLVKRHALAVIPSLPSLKALRLTAKVSSAPKPLIGYAAPVFSPEAQQVATLTTASTKRALRSPTRSFTSFFSGNRANLEALRQGLAPLPETEDELRRVAKSLNAAETDLVIGPSATETAVKQARLSDFRIVYFATHGLIAGEVEGLSEPALAMTLPKATSETDDGLLTASEVARLKLNADWVVLSACNTAAGSKPGAEALSGLARAFFYAGARALLVSHWRVNSEAAVKLTTATFSALTAKPELGRADALRSAMLAVIASSEGESSHPAYWAPFVVVGDNRAK